MYAFPKSSSRSGRLVLAAVAATLLFSLAACHRSPSADVVATVNGKPILRADLERYYQASIGNAPQKPSEEEANVQRLGILHQMIEDEILQQHAAKVNLVASDEEVNAKVTEIKARYTQEEFDNQLKMRNISLDDFKRDQRRLLTRTKVINKEIESKINITDGEIASYYAAHKADFNFIEPQYHMAQIVVTTAPAQQPGNLQNSKATSEADAKKKIQTLYNRLESGEDFSTLASNFSEDSNTASNGGDMGFIPESALRGNGPVYEMISKLKADQYTNVVPVAGPRGLIGFAIYKLISRDPAGQRDLSDPRVQQAIHTQLHNSRTQLLENAYFETLHNEAKVRNYFAEQLLKQGAQ